MSDPYTPAERRYDLTGRSLELCARYGFGVHITTKSDLVVRDLGRLQAVSRVAASVSFTVTTADDDLARKLEPGAPPSSARFRAMSALAAAGIYTGVTMMPILPFIEDDEGNVVGIVEQTREAGGQYVIPGLGMTLRDRQRAYYYRELDRLFPGLSRRYRERYGERYSCRVPDARRLEASLRERCARYGLLTDIAGIAAQRTTRQLPLL